MVKFGNLFKRQKRWGVRIVLIPAMLGMLVSIVLPVVGYFGYDAYAANLTAEQVNQLGGSSPDIVRQRLAAATLDVCAQQKSNETITTNTTIISILSGNIFNKGVSSNQVYSSSTAGWLGLTGGLANGAFPCVNGNGLNITTLLQTAHSNYVDNILCKSGSLFYTHYRNLSGTDITTDATSCSQLANGSINSDQIERLTVNYTNLRNNLAAIGIEQPTGVTNRYWIYYYSAISNDRKCINHVMNNAATQSFNSVSEIQTSMANGNNFDYIYYFASEGRFFGTLGLTNLNPAATSYTPWPRTTGAGNECAQMLSELRVNVENVLNADSDGDGIIDAEDACPLVSDVGRERNPRDGCPEDSTTDANGNVTVTNDDGSTTTTCWDGSTFNNNEGICPPRTGGGSGSTEKDCDAGFITWLMCPMSQGIAFWLTNVLENIVAQIMEVNFLTDPGSESAVREAWQNMLGIANIAFAIVFIVIIYSTATSTGLKNYDIKKILPRLVIAAILVNTSYWICAVAVDLSNIIGANIYGFVTGIGDYDYKYGFTEFFSGTTSILIGVGVVIFATGLLGIAAIAVLTIVALLVVRELLIVVLIMIAPLAFVAWLLPNTEKWFKSWWQNFAKLLLAYPMFTLVCAGAELMQGILTSTGLEGFWSFLAVAILNLLPLAALMPILKGSGKLMGAVQGQVNKLSQPATKALRGRLDEGAKIRQARYRAGEGIRLGSKKDATSPSGRRNVSILDNARLPFSRNATNRAQARKDYLARYEDMKKENYSDYLQKDGRAADEANQQAKTLASLEEAKLDAQRKLYDEAQKLNKEKATIEGNLAISLAVNTADVEAEKRRLMQQLRINPAYQDMQLDKMTAEEGEEGSKYKEAFALAKLAGTRVDYMKRTFGENSAQAQQAVAALAWANSNVDAQQDSVLKMKDSFISNSMTKVGGEAWTQGDSLALLNGDKSEIELADGTKMTAEKIKKDRYLHRAILDRLANGSVKERSFAKDYASGLLGRADSAGNFVDYYADASTGSIGADAAHIAARAAAKDPYGSGADKAQSYTGNADYVRLLNTHFDSMDDASKQALIGSKDYVAGKRFADYSEIQRSHAYGISQILQTLNKGKSMPSITSLDGDDQGLFKDAFDALDTFAKSTNINTQQGILRRVDDRGAYNASKGLSVGGMKDYLKELAKDSTTPAYEGKVRSDVVKSMNDAVSKLP